MGKRAFRITISIMAAVLFALIGMNISLDNEKTWDVCYEMTNTNVTWLQTFHSGAWNSDGR